MSDFTKNIYFQEMLKICIHEVLFERPISLTYNFSIFEQAID